MTEETYRRLMLKHAQQQTALLFGLLALKVNKGSDHYQSITEEISNLQKETDEALKEKPPLDMSRLRSSDRIHTCENH